MKHKEAIQVLFNDLSDMLEYSIDIRLIRVDLRLRRIKDK